LGVELLGFGVGNARFGLLTCAREIILVRRKPGGLGVLLFDACQRSIGSYELLLVEEALRLGERSGGQGVEIAVDRGA